MSNAKKSITEVIKFSLVGVLNTFVDWFLFWVLLSCVGLDKNIAQILATAAAMTSSYFINRYWTFHKTGRVKVLEMAKFIVVNLVSLLVSLLCLNIFYDVLKVYNWANYFIAIFLDFKLSGDSAIMFCKVCAAPLSFAVNFIGNKLWVFVKKDNK